MIRAEKNMFSRGARAGAAAALFVWACQPRPARAPWGDGVSRLPFEHAEVRTLNQGYERTKSHVLVREIDRPTRATLDYAAYHANFMIADLEPESTPPAKGGPNTSNPFRGLLEKGTLTGDVRRTPLTEGERRMPLAFAP